MCSAAVVSLELSVDRGSVRMAEGKRQESRKEDRFVGVRTNPSCKAIEATSRSGQGEGEGEGEEFGKAVRSRLGLSAVAPYYRRLTAKQQIRGSQWMGMRKAKLECGVGQGIG